MATDFVEVLNQLTLHNQLEFLTLIPCSNILVTKGLLRNTVQLSLFSPPASPASPAPPACLNR